MDQSKIGKFIAECRKKNGLTQMQLAEKLNITDRAVSKWENGKSMPDSSIMLSLCNELEITVNELLSGEAMEMTNYNEGAEKTLLEMLKQKEESDRRLLKLEIVIGAISIAFFLVITAIASWLEMQEGVRILIISFATIFLFLMCLVLLKIEQVAGYYECAKCHYKYVPTYKAVNFAPHMGRTRYMKCPNCGKKSWQKKVLNKE